MKQQRNSGEEIRRGTNGGLFEPAFIEHLQCDYYTEIHFYVVGAPFVGSINIPYEGFKSSYPA